MSDSLIFSLIFVGLFAVYVMAQNQSQHSNSKPCFNKQGNNVVFTGDCKIANATLLVPNQRLLVQFNASREITNDLLTVAIIAIGECVTEGQLVSSSLDNNLALKPGFFPMEFPLTLEVVSSGFAILSPKSKVEHASLCKPAFQKVQNGYKIDFLFATGAPVEFSATIYNATLVGSQNSNVNEANNHRIKWNTKL